METVTEIRKQARFDHLPSDTKEFRFGLPGAGFVFKIYEQKSSGKIVSASIFQDGRHVGTYYRLSSKADANPVVWKWMRLDGAHHVPFTTIRAASSRLCAASGGNDIVRYEAAVESP